MLIVAHRISTLKDAGRIVVFEHGQLVEQGSFRDLAADPATRLGTMYAIQQRNHGAGISNIIVSRARTEIRLPADLTATLALYRSGSQSQIRAQKRAPWVTR